MGQGLQQDLDENGGEQRKSPVPPAYALQTRNAGEAGTLEELPQLSIGVFLEVETCGDFVEEPGEGEGEHLIAGNRVLFEQRRHVFATEVDPRVIPRGGFVAVVMWISGMPQDQTARRVLGDCRVGCCRRRRRSTPR